MTTSITLYSLHFSKSVAGFGKPSTRAVPAMLAGDLCQVSGEIVRPCADDVRQALPHYYRKALDRTGGAFWFTDGRPGGYLTLRDSRGRYLNTLYAIPYLFTCGPKA